jgi:hypothetical protein
VSSFLFSGAMNILKQVRITTALDEIVRFINLVKTEVHYTTADFEKIFLKGKLQNYKYISFSDNEIFLDKSVGDKLNEDFNSFINKIGTTDEQGQLNICEEYKERFDEIFTKRKAKEKEKLQMNTALSLFGALTVLIFFL